MPFPGPIFHHTHGPSEHAQDAGIVSFLFIFVNLLTTTGRWPFALVMCLCLSIHTRARSTALVASALHRRHCLTMVLGSMMWMLTSHSILANSLPLLTIRFAPQAYLFLPAICHGLQGVCVCPPRLSCILFRSSTSSGHVLLNNHLDIV